MEQFVERLPLEGLDRGLFGDVSSQLMRIWHSTNGILTPEYKPILPYLLNLSARAKTNDVPEILQIGRRSLMANVFGSDWALAPADERSEISPEFRGFVAEGYHRAIADLEPQLDIVSSPLELPGGNTIWVTYTRFIAPISLAKGVRLLLSAAEEVHPGVGFLSSCRTDSLGHSPRTIHLPESRPAHGPTAGHRDAAG